MNQTCQQKHLALTRFNQLPGILSLFRALLILADLLERYQAVAELDVLRFIHGTYLTGAQRLKDTIALVNDDIGEEQAGERIRCGAGSSCDRGERLATGKAMRGQCRINRATRLAIYRGRNVSVYTTRHICTVPSSLPEAIYCPSGDHVTDVT